MFDPGYQSLNLTIWNAQTKELAVLGGIVLLHIPLFILYPLFTGTMYASLILYYYKHRKAHLNPTWAKQHLRWHYEHHLGGNCAANWCVTWPWLDYLMGTRLKSKTLE
jgi:sterol desaturase/sphingolipid hydroxylase (fatty acid hydroxylase superfamily)